MMRGTEGNQGRAPRVLHFITGFCVGGSERQTVRLVNGLVDAGYDVRLACFRKYGALLAEVEGIPLEHFPVTSFRELRTLGQLARFARFLRRERIDLVHATGTEPNVFAVPAARLARVPVIASVRDLGDPWSPLMRCLQRHACGAADAVIANSGAVRDRLLADGHCGGRIEVIHNSVRPLPIRADADPLAEEYGIEPDRPVVGVVARLVRVKGVEYFVEAAARVARRFPRAAFAVIGGPVPEKEDGYRTRYEDELRERAHDRAIADRMVFTGDREDVGDFVKRFTVAVLPSLSEGLPNAVLEAMSAGKPVVATRVGGIPEIVDDGATGVLVEPRDAEALAEAIGGLLADPARAAALAHAGRLRVRQEFSEQALVDRTARLYADVLERRQPTLATPPPFTPPLGRERPTAGAWPLKSAGGRR